MSAINVIPRTLGLLAVFALAAASARGEDPPATPDVRPGGRCSTGPTRTRDGKMSRQEFQFVVANAPRLRDDPQRADRVFGMLDADEDGSLSPAEFQRLAAMRGGGPPARPPAPAAGRRRRPPGRSPTGRRPRISSRSSRRRSARSSSSSATNVTRPRRRRSRAACCWTPGKGPAAAASRGRPSSPATPRPACWSRPSGTRTRTSGCRRSTGCRTRWWPTWSSGCGRARPTRGTARPSSAATSTSRRAGSSGRSSRPGRSPPRRCRTRRGRGRTSTGSCWRRWRPEGLRPVGDADRAALLRRLSFDLTGLPPTPAEVEAFLADESPGAVETVVDRLLASPAFGERWGRHWLDVARYAESSGKQVNLNYPHAWRYRDYVIDSFNADKPFNRFAHGAGRRRPDAGQGRPAAGRAGGGHGVPGDRPEVAQRADRGSSSSWSWPTSRSTRSRRRSSG